MSESDNIDLITRFCAAWTNPDIEDILGYFTDDAVYHNMPIQAVQGKDAIKGMIEQFMAAFEITTSPRSFVRAWTSALPDSSQMSVTIVSPG